MTQIAAVGILANESKVTLTAFFNIFKSENKEACTKMKCIMTDKDMIERTVINDVFPHVSLYLCQFHVLKIFSRTITTTQMKITAAERDEALRLFRKLTKSKSEEEYNVHYETFEKTVRNSVKNYLKKIGIILEMSGQCMA